jgi:hypothetical protein
MCFPFSLNIFQIRSRYMQQVLEQFYTFLLRTLCMGHRQIPTSLHCKCRLPQLCFPLENSKGLDKVSMWLDLMSQLSPSISQHRNCCKRQNLRPF